MAIVPIAAVIATMPSQLRRRVIATSYVAVRPSGKAVVAT
jgi:hypothetical protein